LDAVKRGFHRGANCIFGKVGTVASEEVVNVFVIQLMSSKCMPILVYGLEACILNKSDIRSLDFVLNRFCMKLANYYGLSRKFWF